MRERVQVRGVRRAAGRRARRAAGLALHATRALPDGPVSIDSMFFVYYFIRSQTIIIPLYHKLKFGGVV